MPTQIDHVVVAVEDLDEAAKSFTNLGFTVIEGGEHSFRKSRNVLITFQDGSYLEIIAFLEDGPKDDPWWQLLQKGEGWVDYCLFAESIDPLLGRNIQGARGPVEGGRITPSGDRIEWRTLRIPADPNVKVPFVIEDVTARSLRVPGGNAAIHANGVTGIRKVTSLVNELNAASGKLAEVLGLSAAAKASDQQTFGLGGHELTLFDPTLESGRAANLLHHRGPLPYEVEFVVGGDSRVEGDGKHIVHGAQIAFVQN